MEAEQKVFNEILNKYTKVLIINLTNDNYRIVKDNERIKFTLKTFKLSEYLDQFLASNLLFKDDKEKFKKFIEEMATKNYVIYRRKTDGGFHWSLLELTPCTSYSQTNQEFLLSVRDIGNIFETEYEIAVDNIGIIDQMTGLYNKFAYERDCLKCCGDTKGILYADLNGLKHTNDTNGHKGGDRLIQEFAKLLKRYFNEYKCYRIGGDEFLVLADNLSSSDFLRKAKSFHRLMQSMDLPMASVGFNVGGEINKVFEYAEEDMYEDKKLFYKNFPKLMRMDYQDEE